MALHLPVSTDYGVTATYHHIGAAHINWRDGGCTVILFSYVDADARAAGRQPLGSVTVVLNIADFTGPDITRAEIYNQLKQRTEWAGATDA